MLSDWMSQKRLALLGGSFNPPHVGHLRIAIEAREILRPEQVLFLPAAVPPHKPGDFLLPFSLRAKMVAAAINGAESFALSTLENERQGPSYTIDTLRILKKAHPDHRLCFILGAPDFIVLDSWHDWRALPAQADLVVIPREQSGVCEVERAVFNFWPDARAVACGLDGISHAFEISGKGRVLLMPVPRLDVSSSDIRVRWLAGRSLEFLVPDAVVGLLDEHKKDVDRIWRPAGQGG